MILSTLVQMKGDLFTYLLCYILYSFWLAVNSNKWAWLRLGLCHMKCNDITAAITSLQAALKRDPTDGSVLCECLLLLIHCCGLLVSCFVFVHLLALCLFLYFTDTLHYRPISLLSVCYKLLERLALQCISPTRSKVYSVQTRLVSGKVEALVIRLLPSLLSSKMDSSRT